MWACMRGFSGFRDKTLEWNLTLQIVAGKDIFNKNCCDNLIAEVLLHVGVNGQAIEASRGV